MKLVFFLLFNLSVQISLNFVKNLQNKAITKYFDNKINKNFDFFNMHYQRKLQEIKSQDIDIEYVHTQLVNTLITKEQKEYRGFQARKNDDDAIEIYYQIMNSEDRPIGKPILIFEVLLEKYKNQKILKITNIDEKKYIQFSSTHAQFARTIKKVDDLEQLTEFIKESFESMKNLLPHFQSAIKEFIHENLIPFLELNKYEIVLRARKFKTHYETSEVIDVFGIDQKKYLEILIYNVDQFFIGIQIVSRNKIFEIKLPKKNLKDSFEMNKFKFEEICPNIANFSLDKINEIFGLSFEEKKERIFKIMSNECFGFSNKSEFVQNYPVDSFKMDVSSLDCSLKKTKIFVEEINNAYLQYIYVIFDNEFFRSGYMISPLTQKFDETFLNLIKESVQEIQKISHLKQTALDIHEPTFELIKKQIDDASVAANLEVKCDDEQEDIMVCKCKDFPITIIKKADINDQQYFKVQFVKKPKKNQETIKVVNELKIPTNNGFNLHERIFEVARDFYKNYKLKI